MNEYKLYCMGWSVEVENRGEWSTLLAQLLPHHLKPSTPLSEEGTRDERQSIYKSIKVTTLI